MRGDDPDGDVVMAAPGSPSDSTHPSPSPHEASRLLSIVAAGELPVLPLSLATDDTNEGLEGLLAPFLPLLTRLQSSRRATLALKTLPEPSAVDRALLRVENASEWRQYAQVLTDLSPSQLQAAVSPPKTPAFRRFERGSAAERVQIVICEWLLAAPGSLERSELLLAEMYQEQVAAILVLTLASPKLQTQLRTAENPLGLDAVARRCLAVPLGPVLLSRVAVNDPSSVEQLLDVEQDALSGTTAMQDNAKQTCVLLAKLAPVYAARLRDKLSEQTTSLHCAAIAFELLTTCTSREDMGLASREAASAVSAFQQDAVGSLTKIKAVLLDTLDSTNATVLPYELTAALGVCVGLQVLGSFPLTEAERLRLLHSIDKLAPSWSSSRAISLAFIVVVLLWYPLAPALSKAPNQRDDHTKSAVTLSQQVLVALFHARDAGAGPLFVVSAVLFYTKAPALVPFLASQALRAEYLHVFGDVVLKPVLTENLLAREVLTFPPAARVSALDAVSSGHGQHEFTLRGLHGLLCEKSFLRHHHAHKLESWLAAQVGEQAALPVHPLLVSLLLEWVENYIMAFEYPIAQAPRRLQLSIVPLRSSILAKWLSSPCLTRAYDSESGREHELMWARGALGLTYALQFNQRLRHATMVAGSKLSSLVPTSSVASGASVSAALGPSADICLHYDLSAFPLRNIVTQALAHGDQGGAFEYVAPTLLKLMMEEHPQFFDAAAASASSGSTLQLLPLAASPQDVAERDLARSWFRRRRKCGELPDVRVVKSPVSWTAAQSLLLELQAAPIEVVMRELPVLVDGFLPYAVVSSQTSPRSRQEVAAFCAQLAALYETRARREQGASVVEEPFRLVDDAHDGVFLQPALLRVLLGLVRDVRAAANVHVTKCDPSLVPVEGMGGASSVTASVQQHQLLQDCLLTHGLLKRLLSLSSESRDDEVAEESRALLCAAVDELLTADAAASSPSPPRLLLAIHTQGYDVALVPTLVANPLMEFVAEGAEKDLPKWRFRLRVVLSLCAEHLSGSRQSAAMQQALRVVWNKLRNGVGSSGDNSTGYVNLLGEVLPWIVDACSQNADLSAELVHFLLKLQRQQQSGSSSKSREGSRRGAVDAAGKPQEQRQLLEQVLRSSPRAYIPASPKALSPRSAEAVGGDSNAWNEGGSGLAYSIKRHLSIAATSPSRYGAAPCSPRAGKGATSPEDSDDEVIQLQRLSAHLASGETVEEWIRSYELERGNFASFAVFTEVKLDEVQETYVEQAGRPNAVEAAACCATLLKMPGIVGCYRTLLDKMSAGIQGAIYLPEAASFYSRTPYFERVRELERTLLASRSISDPNVLRAVTIDDVARIFQYVPFSHVQAGIAKVYATNSSMLDQLVAALQDQQGTGVDDPDYPVHVPLATSAQICRAITHNAATFSASGREMILCAIVNLVEADSFRDVYQHFDTHGKMCFLHHLSFAEGMDQLELVVDTLPNAGESLFRLYLATCSGQIVPPSPKDVFFLKLLSPDMEFFFVSDLAAYLTEAQWQLLSREFEKYENERKARKQRRASLNAADFDIEIEEDASDGRQYSSQSADASIDRFQMIMMNYLRHHNLSSAQLLQLDLGSGGSSFSPPSPPHEVNHEYIAAIRLKMLKKIFMMLTREEKATWMDRINAKHPTESYKKRIQDLKDVATAALNKPPDLSDPATHMPGMKADLKIRWLEVIIECILSETENSARVAALKQALLPFANGKMPPPAVPPQQPTLASTEKTLQQMLSQLSDADKAALLSKFASSSDKAPVNSDASSAATGDDKTEQEQAINLSRRLKRKLTAVNAVSEPMEWQEFVRLGCLDVGCQTTFDTDQEAGDTVAPTKHTPLTLTALLGKNTGKSSKKERYQKINSVAVPRAISGLITSWRMNTDQLIQFAKKSLANVLKIIADAYGEMLTAARRKTQQQRLPYATPRGSGRMLTLSQIVYQSFLHSYGLPTIADMHLLAFSCALETYRSQHLRVDYFSRFCFEEAPKGELTNYLEFLECIVISQQTPPVSSKRSRLIPRISVPDKENWLISVDRAQEIAQLCFRDMRKTTVATFCENLATIAAQGNSTAVLPPPAATAPTAESTSGEQVLNVDHLLQLVVVEWRFEQVRRERHLLDAFRAGDVNGDGQLTSAEFTQIVLSIDASRDMGDILLMYSDTLRRTQCEQLDAQVFLQVAREHELDRVVWQGDGDLFGVVNEVTDMEATWAHVRGFFVGTLEALARDLPPTHFLRLVWARFWHLMRQLHDAAAESDGIVTPWEGIQYKRDQPVLALAPRSNTRRRDSLPNFLFPDTARITGKMSEVHHPEVFDAPTIHSQFAYLLDHMSAKVNDIPSDQKSSKSSSSG
uniref:EF-hand domain-containing protein n=1 Tax=Phytophthora ramorum TaxID=164328 RepID=H3HE48_PHYRM